MQHRYNIYACSNLRFHGDRLFSIIRKKRFIEENFKLKVVPKNSPDSVTTILELVEKLSGELSTMNNLIKQGCSWRKGRLICYNCTISFAALYYVNLAVSNFSTYNYSYS